MNSAARSTWPAKPIPARAASAPRATPRRGSSRSRGAAPPARPPECGARAPTAGCRRRRRTRRRSRRRRSAWRTRTEVRRRPSNARVARARLAQLGAQLGERASRRPERQRARPPNRSRPRAATRMSRRESVIGRDPSIERRDRRGALGAIERRGERSLADADGARIATAQSCDRCRPFQRASRATSSPASASPTRMWRSRLGSGATCDGSRAAALDHDARARAEAGRATRPSG